MTDENKPVEKTTDAAPVVEQPNIEQPTIDLVRVIPGGRVTAADVDGGVTETKLESKTLLVLGEVRRKGFITFGPTEKCTMMNLIFKMGSLPPYAKDKAIRVIRKNAAGEDRSVNPYPLYCYIKNNPFRLANSNRLDPGTNFNCGNNSTCSR